MTHQVNLDKLPKHTKPILRLHNRPVDKQNYRFAQVFGKLHLERSNHLEILAEARNLGQKA